MPENLANAAHVARLIGLAKPNGIEGSGMKTLYAALSVIIILPVKNLVNPKRNRNKYLPKPYPLVS